MKKLLTLFLITFTFLSCTKENFNQIKDDLVGTWELQQQVCFECPVYVTNYPSGNGHLLVICSDGNYESRFRDTILNEGKYYLDNNNICKDSPNKTIFSTAQNPGTINYEIKIENDELTLRTPSCFADGAISTYRKIR